MHTVTAGPGDQQQHPEPGSDVASVEAGLLEHKVL